MSSDTWRRIYYDHREEFSQKQREEIFVRACRLPDGKPGGPDNLHCEGEGCGKHLREGDAWEIHHKKGCHEGGKAEIENGELLGSKCCHQRETAEQTKRRAKADAQHKAAMGLKKKPKQKIKSRGFQKRGDNEWKRPIYWAD